MRGGMEVRREKAAELGGVATLMTSLADELSTLCQAEHNVSHEVLLFMTKLKPCTLN